MTVIPAFNRDYKSKAAVQTDWDACKDFIIAGIHPYSGSYVNKTDVENTQEEVWVQYSKNTKIMRVK